MPVGSRGDCTVLLLVMLWPLASGAAETKGGGRGCFSLLRVLLGIDADEPYEEGPGRPGGRTDRANIGISLYRTLDFETLAYAFNSSGLEVGCRHLSFKRLASVLALMDSADAGGPAGGPWDVTLYSVNLSPLTEPPVGGNWVTSRSLANGFDETGTAVCEEADDGDGAPLMCEAGS